ncbi:MAG: hypothetical protein A3C11_02185 [Candidatus Sungbacteria bacterium RIFCSPHIGHO2_02_FULL_49_12]|uniref:Uncharacterized protein n=1 Tax=Candidatus Sungbacteria bacterium RIFCSPHIGHO2_02_FULL_49_12 TaxID=1802271 RepID=A0A1G2KLY6_9BACT|nr:MAG: hypothetical protein A3C11_02185 [Candidatus Sungbacteria bacterium RIFCSPHIGHO2_02_FULL_49_12]
MKIRASEEQARTEIGNLSFRSSNHIQAEEETMGASSSLWHYARAKKSAQEKIITGPTIG